MAEEAQPNRGGVRVYSVERLGRPISPVVLSAAEEIGHRAMHHAERLLIDPANLLEEAAAVSRAMSPKGMSQHPYGISVRVCSALSSDASTRDTSESCP
jgi:hypothetical protein